jgi:4-aminobutyrate aminotransferase
MTKQELYAQYGPKLITPLPGPKAKAAIEADGRLISPSYTRSYPLVARRGRGIRVEDVDGNEFLDFAAGIAVN